MCPGSGNSTSPFQENHDQDGIGCSDARNLSRDQVNAVVLSDTTAKVPTKLRLELESSRPQTDRCSSAPSLLLLPMFLTRPRIARY